MNIEFNHQLFKKHEYDILLDDEAVGVIMFDINNNVLYINHLEVYEEFRNKKIAENVLKRLFEKYDEIQYIIGEVLDTDVSKYFWRKILKIFDSKLLNTSCYSNCSSSFVLSNKEIKDFDETYWIKQLIDFFNLFFNE